MKRIPSAAIRSTRRWTTRLSSFMLGMPYTSSPPMRSARSKTVTQWPALLSWSAQASPDGPGTDDGDPLAGAHGRRLGVNPAFVEAAFDDGQLDLLDRHRFLVQRQRARAFAWSRANAAGELGEVVGALQALQRLAPQAAVDQAVPFGDQVVDRAAGSHAVQQRAGMAERNAAAHAAGGLRLAAFLRELPDAFPDNPGRARWAGDPRHLT